jgi:hypothetical protein
MVFFSMSALVPDSILASSRLLKKCYFDAKGRHTREGGYPEFFENNGFPSARE